MSIPSHLLSDCPFDICSGSCVYAVKPAPDGRWYITMGHPGFNSRANNANGYASRKAAVAAVMHYQGKGFKAR